MRTNNNAEIKAGTTILTAKPFVYALKSQLRTENCDNCLESGKVLKCSGCQYVYYCNRVCQKEAWVEHKPECTNLRRITPRIVPDAARIMAKIIIKLKKGGDQEKGYYSESGFRKFKDLMSHYSDIKLEQKRMEHFTSLCAVLFEFLGETLVPNSAELMGIYGRLCINGFNILNSEMISIGTGIYLGASIIDHSCDPNALAVFQGTTLYIRTLKTLPSLDWDQVFISYIDVLNSPFDRQEDLKQSYFFLCKCPRCIEEPVNGLLDSAACPNSNCNFAIDLSSSDRLVVNSCTECGAKISKEFIDEFYEVSDFTQMHLQNMKQSSIAYLDVSKVCLKKQHGFLHPLNLIHVKTLDSAFESSIDLGLWEDAIIFGTQLVPGYKKYYGMLHPLLGLLYLKIAKILIYENKSLEALPQLYLARDILHITHGAAHPICRVTLAPLLHQAVMETSLE